MKKLLTCAIAASCLIAFESVVQARSLYDGSWDLLFVTQRGACDDEIGPLGQIRKCVWHVNSAP